MGSSTTFIVQQEISGGPGLLPTAALVKWPCGDADQRRDASRQGLACGGEVSFFTGPFAPHDGSG